MNARRIGALFLAIVVGSLTGVSGVSAQGRAEVVAAVDQFISAFNSSNESAMAASCGPQAEAYEYASGIDQFRRIDWLPHPWQRLGLAVPSTSDSRVIVLDRLVSGSFVTQRERLEWWKGRNERQSLVRTVIYKIRGGHIHRIWYMPSEPDPATVPAVLVPTFPLRKGPIVWMDAWHHNMHTPEGTYWPLAELLRRHGYRVRAWEAPFTTSALDTIRLLVVANAIPGNGATGASAFSNSEVKSLVQWVQEGGSLLLIADHDPYAGAAAALAAEFGVAFHDGLARDTSRRRGSNIMFRRGDGTLRSHPITDGTEPRARVDSVATFAGQAFRADENVHPLLVLPQTAVVELRSNGRSKRTVHPADGWLQAGVRSFGKGRVALFGEAAIFRHLKLESGSMQGAENTQFVVNLFEWLATGI